MQTKTIRQRFAKYVSLGILGQVALSCYTLADTFFVSAKLGANGLAALNLAFPIFCFLNGVGLMIGIGGGNKYAIARARKEEGKANIAFTNACYMVIAFALLFVLAGAFASKYIVALLGADESLLEMTDTYAKTMLLFAPTFLTNNLLQCFVRNDGKPSLSMAAMIVGSLSNILLDYIFIFPLDMGIFGAILATGLSPMISIAALAPYLIRRKNNFHLLISKPAARLIGGILGSGFPSFLTEATSGIVMFSFNLIILPIEGNIGVAAFGVITVISLVVIAVFSGLSQGVQPLMSTNYGARKERNVLSLLRYAVITSLIMSSLIYVAVFFGASPITSLFNSEANELLDRLSIEGLRLYFIASPFIGLNIVLATYFIAIEKPLWGQVISLSRGFIILIPLALLLSYIWGINGVWLSYPLSEAIASIIGISLYFVGKRKEKAIEKKEDATN